MHSADLCMHHQNLEKTSRVYAIRRHERSLCLQRQHGIRTYVCSASGKVCICLPFACAINMCRPKADMRFAVARCRSWCTHLQHANSLRALPWEHKGHRRCLDAFFASIISVVWLFACFLLVWCCLLVDCFPLVGSFLLFWCSLLVCC